MKENADFKIRGLFRQFVDNAQCRRIFFAGCHDTGYINELTPHSTNRDRITLVRTANFHPEFSKLGMRIEDFPNLFRAKALNGDSKVLVEAQSELAASSPSRAARVQPVAISTPSKDGDLGRICSFFSKGKCKYGNSCRFIHARGPSNSRAGAATGGKLDDITSWRDGSSAGRTHVPLQMSGLAEDDNSFMSWRGPRTHQTNGSDHAMPQHALVQTQND